MTKDYDFTDSRSDTSSDDGTRNLVLVCVDSHDTGARTLQWYHNNFHQSHYTVGLVHVYTPPRPSRQSLVYPAELYEKYQIWLYEVKRRSLGIMNKMEDICVKKGLKYEVFVVENMGTISGTICQLAEEEDAEVIVIGQSVKSSTKRIGRRKNVKDHVRNNTQANIIIASM